MRCGSAHHQSRVVQKIVMFALQDSSPLLAAAAAGRGSAMRVLLSAGALPDAPDVTGAAALMVAAAHGHVACMELLLGFDAGKPQSLCHGGLQATKPLPWEVASHKTSAMGGCKPQNLCHGVLGHGDRRHGQG